MKIYGTPTVPQQTRHARRIYVGGIPPNYTDEDGLRDFLNHVLSTGLGEENDQSYVLSIYINQKKCFAFVELKAIDLTTAALDLDGIIYKKIVLKILRANEYKPELIAPALLAKSISLDLTSFAFGCPAAPTFVPSISDQTLDLSDLRLDSLLQVASLSNVERGSLALLGFPFEDVSKTKSTRELGCTAAPKCLRNAIRKFKYGSVQNPEFGIDLSATKLLDIGDVLAGKSHEDCKNNLSATVSEVISRGGIPIVVGGTSDQLYHSVAGVMSVAGGAIGVITISSHLDSKLLDDVRFCPPRNGLNSVPTCEGRYIRFAAQVTFDSRFYEV